MDRKNSPEERVKCSFTKSDSSLVKGRDQLTINSELLISAPVEHVFDIVIRRPEHFWKWHIDRSDPTIQLKVSYDWPTQNAFYYYRMRSGLPLSSLKRWEKGSIQMLETRPPHYALTREYQDFMIGLGKILLMIEWKFSEVRYGTQLLIQHDLVFCSLIANRIFSISKEPPEDIERHTVMPIRKQGVNIIRVCESKNA